MPCRADMPPMGKITSEILKCLCLIEELVVGTPPTLRPDRAWEMAHDSEYYRLPDLFTQNALVLNLKNNSDVLNMLTKELCKQLKEKSMKELSKLSLEMQMWWRDHKIADAKHEVEDKSLD